MTQPWLLWDPLVVEESMQPGKPLKNPLKSSRAGKFAGWFFFGKAVKFSEGSNDILLIGL